MVKDQLPAFSSSLSSIVHCPAAWQRESCNSSSHAIPVIGAVGGALINSYFIDHYQDLARAHFTIRRLERTHGEAPVREAYRRL